MAHLRPTEDNDGARIILGLLQSVEKDGAQSQRRLATELGIALGLVNAYVKRCVKKGLLKVRQAPAGRYAYYLTPNGFSEKSRLTLEFLSSSFSFFRQARGDCAEVFESLRERGYRRVVLAGQSDLTEIATLCALESQIQLVAIVDKKHSNSKFLNIPVRAEFADVEQPFDAIVVTDLVSAREMWDAAVKFLDTNRVFVPRLLATQVTRSVS